MVFGLFRSKKREEKLRLEVQDSFNHVKSDFNKVGDWIRHLDDKHGNHREEIEAIKDTLLAVQGDLMEIKDFISFFGPQISGAVSKQSSTGRVKQSMPSSVQTIDQTAVQSDILEKLTVMERAIVWALLNSELKLSYEDLAALLGKEKSTVRGQINAIKQKSKGLIEELQEPNGKKRLHIPEEIKSKIMKHIKVKVKQGKKSKKPEK